MILNIYDYFIQNVLSSMFRPVYRPLEGDVIISRIQNVQMG
jgi:hypothetical protein